MLIVISDSDIKPNEAAIVNEMFRLGLDLFHIRKYGASKEALSELVESIDAEHTSRLVLHHDHAWGKSIGLNRFHFSEKDRNHWKELEWNGRAENEIYSTSVHSLEEFNDLPNHFSYAFLSPVFDSISKQGYQAATFDLSERRNTITKLIALGGIRADRIKQTMKMGFEGVALLGTIWNSEHPVNEWKLCWNANSSFLPLEGNQSGGHLKVN